MANLTKPDINSFRYGADLTLDQARTKAREERVKVGENRDPWKRSARPVAVKPSVT